MAKDSDLTAGGLAGLLSMIIRGPIPLWLAMGMFGALLAFGEGTRVGDAFSIDSWLEEAWWLEPAGLALFLLGVAMMLGFATRHVLQKWMAAQAAKSANARRNDLIARQAHLRDQVRGLPEAEQQLLNEAYRTRSYPRVDVDPQRQAAAQRLEAAALGTIDHPHRAMPYQAFFRPSQEVLNILPDVFAPV